MPTQGKKDYRKRLNSLEEMSDWGMCATTCTHCGIHNSDIAGALIQCAKCKRAHYCSMQCFNSDLQSHTQFCNTGVMQRAPTVSTSRDLVEDKPEARLAKSLSKETNVGGKLMERSHETLSTAQITDDEASFSSKSSADSSDEESQNSSSSSEDSSSCGSEDNSSCSSGDESDDEASLSSESDASSNGGESQYSRSDGSSSCSRRSEDEGDDEVGLCSNADVDGGIQGGRSSVRDNVSRANPSPDQNAEEVKDDVSSAEEQMFILEVQDDEQEGSELHSLSLYIDAEDEQDSDAFIWLVREDDEEFSVVSTDMDEEVELIRSTRGTSTILEELAEDHPTMEAGLFKSKRSQERREQEAVCLYSTETGDWKTRSGRRPSWINRPLKSLSATSRPGGGCQTEAPPSWVSNRSLRNVLGATTELT